MVDRRARASASAGRCYPISTASRAGLRELSFALAERVREYRAAQPVAEPTRIVLRPQAVDDAGFTVEPDPELPGGFIVRGARPERWIRQTAFDNDEAVGYLGRPAGPARRRGGAGRGRGRSRAAPVTIGDVTFDWEPTTPAGVAVLMSGRGTDRRLEQDDRVGAAERKAARAERRRHRSDDELRERLAEDDRSTDTRGDDGAGSDDRRRAGAGRRADRCEPVAAVTRAGSWPRPGGSWSRSGSSSLTSLTGGLDPARLDALVDALAARRAAGSQVVLVSSGAIAAGLAPLGLTRRPRDLATQQAAAAVGQLLLGRRPTRASFARTGRPSGRCCSPRTT